MPDWDQVYSSKHVSDATPANVLKDNSRLLPRTGRALDYASGLSGNGVHLARHGLDVVAWDLSTVATDKINEYSRLNKLSLVAEQKNLESDYKQLTGQFDVLVVSFFLHRESLYRLPELLKPGGLLFYQTFSGEQRNGVGPSRTEFRLERGELLSVFDDMELIYYREDCMAEPEGLVIPDQVFFVARKI